MNEPEITEYKLSPTIKEFHENPAQFRCIVGEVGSGKTSAAALEVGWYLPKFLYDTYGIKKTRWAIVRNTYSELIDSTQDVVFEWFPDGIARGQDSRNYTLNYDDFTSELWFRACDRPEDARKFKSMQITGYWIDESIEVAEGTKRMLKTRIGRFPKKCPVRFGIETTNPPDVEHPLYSQYTWNRPPPGPIPPGNPLENHSGFWQHPRENEQNLRPGYYDDLRSDFAENPDWIDVYLDGKPGITLRGKLVYHNFRRDLHVARQPLIWAQSGLWRGWDNSGNSPACAVIQIVGGNRIQVLAEFHTDKMGIVDFGEMVKMQSNAKWPRAEFIDWADPAGESLYSKKEGGFTSNAQLLRDIGISVLPSEQNLTARINAVDRAMGRIDGLLIDPSCTRLINGFLGGYCYPELGTTGEYSEGILKNKFSHIHEALQYVIVKLVSVQEQRHNPKQVQKYANTEYDEFAW